MPTKTVTVKIVGDESSLTRATGKASSALESVASRGKAAFGALTNIAGQTGAFGPLQGVMDSVGQGLDYVAQNGKRVGSVMIGVGGAAAAAGAMMIASAQKDQVAHNQLKQAVENTGKSYASYKGRIEEAIHGQERFGHTADQTQDALRKLVDATGDPAKALQYMGLVADLAASKHIALADAAALVAKILGGTGGKALAGYGIHIDKTKDKTQETTRAIDELSKKLSGQAASAADTAGGRFEALKAHLENLWNSIAGRAGPVLLGVGSAFAAVGSVIEVSMAVKGAIAARSAQRLAAAQAEAAAAATRLGVAEGLAGATTAEFAAAANSAALANERLGLSSAGSTSKTRGLAGGIGAATGALVAWAAAGAAVDATMNKTSFGVQHLTSDLLIASQTGDASLRSLQALSALKVGTGFNDLADGIRAITAPSINQRLNDFGVGLITLGQKTDEPLDKARKAVKAVDDALAQMVSSGHSEEAAAALAAIGDSPGMSPRRFADLKGMLSGYNEALFATGNAASGAALGVYKIGPAGMAANTAMRAATNAAKALDSAFKVLSGNMSADQALIAAKQSAVDLGKSLHDNGRQFGYSSEKARANQTALIAAADAAMKLRDAQVKSGVGAASANVTYNSQIAALRRVMAQAGLTTAQINALLGRYTTLAKSPPARPTVEVLGALQAAAQVKGVRSQIDVLKGKIVQVEERGGAGAAAEIRRLRDEIGKLQSKYVTVHANLVLGGFSSQAAKTLAAAGFSRGGRVPMTPGAVRGKDSVLSVLTPDEFVVRADGSNLADAVRAFHKAPAASRAAAPATMTAPGPAAGGITIYGDIVLNDVTDPPAMVKKLQDYVRSNGVIRGLKFG